MPNRIGRVISAEDLRAMFDADIVATYVHIVSGRPQGAKKSVTHYALLNEDGTLPGRTLCARKIQTIDRVRRDTDAATCTTCNRHRFWGGKGYYPHGKDKKG